MCDTHNPQACLNSIASPRGDSTAPVEEVEVVVPVPGAHENVQESTNMSDKDTGSTQASGQLREAKGEIERLSATLVKEQQELQKKTAELNSATTYMANLQDQLMKVQTESYTQTGKLRKKISDMAWGRAGMRRQQLVAIIREKNRASTDVACRHAELQNEIAVLKDALSTLRKVKLGVSVRE